MLYLSWAGLRSKQFITTVHVAVQFVRNILEAVRLDAYVHDKVSDNFMTVHVLLKILEQWIQSRPIYCMESGPQHSTSIMTWTCCAAATYSFTCPSSNPIWTSGTCIVHFSSLVLLPTDIFFMPWLAWEVGTVSSLTQERSHTGRGRWRISCTGPSSRPWAMSAWNGSSLMTMPPSQSRSVVTMNILVILLQGAVEGGTLIT